MTNISKLQESFKQIEDILQNLDLREYSYYESQELLSNFEEIKTVVLATEIANQNKEQPQLSQHVPQTLREIFENYYEKNYVDNVVTLEVPELYHKGDIVTTGHGYDIGIVAEDATPEKVKIFAKKVEPCFESLYGGTANPTFSYGCKWYSTGIHTTLEEWNKMSEAFWGYNKYKDIDDDRDER